MSFIKNGSNFTRTDRNKPRTVVQRYPLTNFVTNFLNGQGLFYVALEIENDNPDPITVRTETEGMDRTIPAYTRAVLTDEVKTYLKISAPNATKGVISVHLASREELSVGS